jgi:hypothetical protein
MIGAGSKGHTPWFGWWVPRHFFTVTEDEKIDVLAISQNVAS